MYVSAEELVTYLDTLILVLCASETSCCLQNTVSHLTHDKLLDHVASVTAHSECKYTSAVVASLKMLTQGMLSALTCQAVSRKHVSLVLTFSTSTEFLVDLLDSKMNFRE